jgi:succinoglycan biosynthesis protein ExoA
VNALLQTHQKMPNQTATSPQAALVSVVVPVRNEERYIAGTLDQLLAQDRGNLAIEILVVDGRSTDRTREIVGEYVKQFPEVSLLDNPLRLSSAARNIAIKQMRGDYLVVVDGHCEIPSRTYFRDLVDAFDESGADCLGRPQPLDVTSASPMQLAIAAARKSWLGHHPESFIYSDKPQFVPAKSVAVAYRREVFEKVGLFDEAFDAHEDGEFNYRCDKAGLTCYFAPAITVRYFPRKTLSSLFKQMVRYGRGRVRVARKHPETWGIGFLVPAMMILFIFGGLALSLLLPHLWIAYLLGLSVYLVALATSGIAMAIEQQSVGLLIRVPAVLAVVHLGAGWGVLAELVGR